MRYRFLLLLAPLNAWSQKCICGYANQDGLVSALAERSDTVADVTTEINADDTEKRSESATVLVNGTRTGPHEYPFIAAVVYKSGPQRILCAGAIVDERHVLISAHCVNGLRVSNLGVYVGSTTFNTGEAKLRTVAALHTHPRWDPERIVYDIALLQLQDALTIDRRETGLICILGKPRDVNNQAVVAVAWDSASLVQAKFETHDLASCVARPTEGPQFCAYRKGMAACDRASDGPLLLWKDRGSTRYFAFGVSSYGQSCKEFPEVVTDVTRLRPWIQSVLQASGGKICE
ncbi:hypothetical protein ED733_008861 [Metarhizium rileyi]|uniref:Peptidase S1 domain-containing protein n=1 Tax=Metarhizium rileyi (strain RCEF 4871) TaxID=1649241 RepID=A0A5C6GQ62_METRR|nr:hypothetical protein ED733_008861 [Metarhizium rileyi]